MAQPLVVTRYPKIQELTISYQFQSIMHNEEEQSDTVRIALSAPEAKNWQGCMFLTGDQPLLSKESLCRMVKEFANHPDNVIRLSYQEEGGNPVIFPRKYFDALKNLTGDHGGEIIKLPAEREFELWDVDSEESLAKVEQLMHLS